jgi:hypothetical protein
MFFFFFLFLFFPFDLIGLLTDAGEEDDKMVDGVGVLELEDEAVGR